MSQRYSLKRLLVKIAACSAALYFAAAVFPSIRLADPLAPLFAGLVLAVLNISLRPLLILILSPLVMITAGLLTLVINAWMVMLTSLIIRHQYSISGFWLTVIVACVVAVFDLGSQRLFVPFR